jgi:hypothetical protein
MVASFTGSLGACKSRKLSTFISTTDTVKVIMTTPGDVAGGIALCGQEPFQLRAGGNTCHQWFYPTKNLAGSFDGGSANTMNNLEGFTGNPIYGVGFNEMINNAIQCADQGGSFSSINLESFFEGDRTVPTCLFGYPRIIN